MSEHDLAALIAMLERVLGANWRDVVGYLIRANPESAVAKALERGDYGNALIDVKDAASRFAVDEHAAYIRAGTDTAKWLDGEVTPLVRFDVTNDLAVKWADANELDKVREISEDVRGMLRAVITDGVRAGDNPLVIAREIRASIGLTEIQAGYVASYRDALEGGNFANALNRALSHGQSDRAIAAASAADRPLTAAQIDTAVNRYRANMLTYRSQMIARTEALRVAHQGNEDALRMAVARGDIDADALIRTWNHTNTSDHPRAFHESMQGQTRKFGQTFLSGRGKELRYPGDPSAGAEEVIGCACALSTRYRPNLRIAA